MVVALDPRQKWARRSIVPALQEERVAEREELKSGVPPESSALCRRWDRSRTILGGIVDRGSVRRRSDLDVRGLAEGQLAWNRSDTTRLSVVTFVDGREDRQLDRLSSNL